MPHKLPEDRIYTVMSVVFYIGLGEEFDGAGNGFHSMSFRQDRSENRLAWLMRPRHHAAP